MTIQNDDIKLYIMAFKEAWAKSKEADYEMRKTEAKNAAAEVVPSVAEAMRIWAIYFRPGNNGPKGLAPVKTPQIELGANASRAIGTALMEMGALPKTHSSTENLSAVTLYRMWVDQNKTIPTDSALSHFGDLAAPTWAAARIALKNEGYEFNKLPNGFGWEVLARPMKAEEKLMVAMQDRPQDIVALLMEHPDLVGKLLAQ